MCDIREFSISDIALAAESAFGADATPAETVTRLSTCGTVDLVIETYLI